MRIGLFTNNYRPLVNGLASAVAGTAQALRRAGHRVVVVAPRYAGAAAEPDCLRVPGLRAPTHHAYVLPSPWSPAVARAVADLGLDVYHAQHPFLLGAAAARWARRAGRPLVFTYHTHYERYGHYCPGLARLAGRLALRRALRFAGRADLVVAPTPGVAARLRARGLRTPIALVTGDADRETPLTGVRRIAAHHPDLTVVPGAGHCQAGNRLPGGWGAWARQRLEAWGATPPAPVAARPSTGGPGGFPVGGSGRK